LEEAPEIYEKTALFVEAADWLVWQLTGRLTRNACCAGYKNLWDKREGYPKNAFFKALDPRLDHVMETKFAGAVAPLGGCAGGLASKMAAKTGLRPGTAVAVPIIDAHAFVPAVGIAGPGALLAVMGTSTCHITLGHTPRPVRGICGVAEDGIYPGLFAYEAGQCCVGDHFQWATEQIVPQKYVERAQKEGISLHEFLAKKKKEPGASGLLALDWWNGNRSVLADGDLSGLLVGMGLKTTAADVYWALVEATAFGTRMIVENFCAQGLPVEAFFAAGGIAKKSPHMMQIYADVLNLPVRVGASLQAGALGAAIFGAVAGGAFANVFAAAERLGRVEDRPYDPSPASVTVYEKLYNEYKTLHDYFGRGGNGVMKRLRAIKNAPH
jgi:L-ribulokinase